MSPIPINAPSRDVFDPLASFRVGLAQIPSALGGGALRSLDLLYGLLPGDQSDSFLSKAAEEIDRWSYEWVGGGYTPHKISGIKELLTAKGFMRGLLEYGPLTGALMGITVLSGGVATPGAIGAISATTIGEAAKSIEEANPDLDDWKKFLLAGTIGAANSVLERLPIGKFLDAATTKTLKTRLVKALTGMIEEPLTEGAQEVLLALGSQASGRGDATIFGAFAETIQDKDKLQEVWTLFQEAAYSAIPVATAFGVGTAVMPQETKDQKVFRLQTEKIKTDMLAMEEVTIDPVLAEIQDEGGSVKYQRMRGKVNPLEQSAFARMGEEKPETPRIPDVDLRHGAHPEVLPYEARVTFANLKGFKEKVPGGPTKGTYGRTRQRFKGKVPEGKSYPWWVGAQDKKGEMHMVGFQFENDWTEPEMIEWTKTFEEQTKDKPHSMYSPENITVTWGTPQEIPPAPKEILPEEPEVDFIESIRTRPFAPEAEGKPINKRKKYFYLRLFPDDLFAERALGDRAFARRDKFGTFPTMDGIKYELGKTEDGKTLPRYLLIDEDLYDETQAATLWGALRESLATEMERSLSGISTEVISPKGDTLDSIIKDETPLSPVTPEDIASSIETQEVVDDYPSSGTEYETLRRKAGNWIAKTFSTLRWGERNGMKNTAQAVINIPSIIVTGVQEFVRNPLKKVYKEYQNVLTDDMIKYSGVGFLSKGSKRWYAGIKDTPQGMDVQMRDFLSDLKQIQMRMRNFAKANGLYHPANVQTEYINTLRAISVKLPEGSQEFHKIAEIVKFLEGNPKLDPAFLSYVIRVSRTLPSRGVELMHYYKDQLKKGMTVTEVIERSNKRIQGVRDQLLVPNITSEQKKKLQHTLQYLKRSGISYESINPAEILEFEGQMLMKQYAIKLALDQAVLEKKAVRLYEGKVIDDIGQPTYGLSPQLGALVTQYKVGAGVRELLTDSHIWATQSTQMSPVRKTLYYTKLMAFGNPFFLSMYNAIQMGMMIPPHILAWKVIEGSAVYAAAKLTGNAKILENSHNAFIRGITDSRTYSREYYEAGYNGVDSMPVNLPIRNGMEVARSILNGGGEWSMDFISLLQSARKLAKPGEEGRTARDALNLATKPFHALFQLSWRTAWGLDRVMRQVGYRYATDSMGLTPAEAAKMTAMYLGDYAAVPRKTRERLNVILFTPTFKIAMGDLYLRMIGGAWKDAQGLIKTGKIDIKRGYTRGLLNMGAIVAGVDMFMTSILGFDRDEFGRRWMKKAFNPLTQKEEDLIVAWNGPHNLFLKYINRARQALKPQVMNSFSRFLYSNVWEVHPLYRTILALVRNDRHQVYNPFDSAWKRSLDTTLFFTTQTAQIFGQFTEKTIRERGAEKAWGERTGVVLGEEIGRAFGFISSFFVYPYFRKPEIDSLKDDLENLKRELTTAINYRKKEGRPLTAAKVASMRKNYEARVAEVHKRIQEIIRNRTKEEAYY